MSHKITGWDIAEIVFGAIVVICTFPGFLILMGITWVLDQLTPDHKR